MRKISVLFLAVLLLLTGCGKKEGKKEPDAAPPSPPAASGQPQDAPDTQSPAPAESPATKDGEEKPSAAPQEGEQAPELKRLLELNEQLEQTKDEKKREEILAEMQTILEKAEAMSAQ